MSTPGHLCWIVEDEAAAREPAAEFLAEGRARGEKTAVFGPEAGILLTELGSDTAIAVDPYVAFLDRGELDPATMFAAFRKQAAIAREEGYAALRVWADMDWLGPLRASPEAIVAFEVLLDRVIAEIGVVVACAYRRSTFDEADRLAVLCVHPDCVGHEDEPPFSLISRHQNGWRLAGEVDLAAVAPFTAAFSASAQARADFDVRELDFIDVAGMRTIAHVSLETNTAIRLHGARPVLRRAWTAAGFDRLAPMVQLQS